VLRQRIAVDRTDVFKSRVARGGALPNSVKNNNNKNNNDDDVDVDVDDINKSRRRRPARSPTSIAAERLVRTCRCCDVFFFSSQRIVFFLKSGLILMLWSAT
jgi:hypothetical protein